MFIKKKFLAIIFVLLAVNYSVFAATEAETELQMQEKLSRMTSQSDEGLVVKMMDDGTEYVDLKGRYQMFSKVKMVDGKQVIICNGNHEIGHSKHKHQSDVTKQQPKRAVK